MSTCTLGFVISGTHLFLSFRNSLILTMKQKHFYKTIEPINSTNLKYFYMYMYMFNVLLYNASLIGHTLKGTPRFKVDNDTGKGPGGT